MNLIQSTILEVSNYFNSFDYIEVKTSLTNDDERGYTEVFVKSVVDEVFVEVKLYINDKGVLMHKDDDVSFTDIWELLHLESMKSYGLAMERLMKKES